ncbi:phosphopyruvate hydratase [Candidatus Saccharibacteria bacterium]|nr:phosphopyruvate hydratase [Candidatus Saccharibacteria bacterium]MCB9817556.1 phosphopyruvate hydratase [Candidatus Nomurabacteria bacterium]HPD98716.1 phosphopyruvate hydratase [Candidatus Saccharibacteria bacterium]
MEIINIIARQILDSRGVPTVEADVLLANGSSGRAAVPSGASTGIHEAHELRDGEAAYHGQSVYKAVDNIHTHILPALRGIPADDQFKIDQIMIDLDGTPNKAQLGANAILAVSLAVAHAAAKSRGILLYKHIADIAQPQQLLLPMPMLNVLNGGKHANGSTDIQESMIMPLSAHTFSQALQMSVEIFQELKMLIHSKGYATTVGDEGGFAPHLKNGNAEAFDLLSEATDKAGYTPGQDVAFAVDVAASELYKDGSYHFTSERKHFNTQDLIEWFKRVVSQYPIVSIEDGLAEDDWDGWKHLKVALPTTQLVGDDLLVTNTERLQYAIQEDAANAILIKPNQIGTLTETIRAIQMAKENGWNTIVSHRSGETEDVSIVHIAIGTGAGQIKTGSLSRSERVAKYNELLRLEAIDSSLLLQNPFTS